MQPHVNRSDSDIEDKASFAQIEKTATAHGTHQAPESLAALSQEEYDAVGKSATRKLDMSIMPILTISYIMNYLDRQNISAAKIAGITKDLHLSTTEYSTVVAVLFASYILFQVPSNLIAAKVKSPGLYIQAMMACWGIVSALTGLVKGFNSLVAVRVCLGIFEAAFFPGALFYLSTWYTKKQLAIRVALLYSGSQIGNAFGGLLCIAILKLSGRHGIEGWRWLFIIEGVATVGLAMIFAVLIPSNPRTTRLLSQQQRDWVVFEQQKQQGQADKNEVSAWGGFKLAITDPKTYLLGGTLYALYTAAAVVQFFPSVVNTLGYSRNITYCLTAPPYLFCCLVMCLNGFLSDKKQQRFVYCCWPMAFIIIANVIAISTTHIGARYFAMMLMPFSTYASAIVLLSWITANLSAPAAKRAAAIAWINSWANTPNIWTAYLYTNPPRYLKAFSVNLAAGVVAIALCCATYFYLRAQNRKLDRGEKVTQGPTQEQLDAGFRYLL